MRIRKTIKILLIWLPSLMVTLFFVPNALDKIQNPVQPDKVITNSALMISVGVILLIATALFLYNKTILIGTFVLTSYIASVTIIHMYKDKPYEIVLLITMCTIFAAYLRKPRLFHQNENT